MARVDPFEVEGFEELNRKLKKLDDRVTRREILKIQRRLAKPIIERYKNELPVGTRDKERFGSVYPAGTLGKSVKADTVPISKSDGNPAIAIRPSKKGRWDSWYKFMVVKKGTKTGSNRRGSRKGKNTAVQEARDRVVKNLGTQTAKEALDKTAEYIQKQINRLS